MTELVNGFQNQDIKQAVVCGLGPGDGHEFKTEIPVYPVYFETEQLPFRVTGMSDEMPYPSTRYCDLTDIQVVEFRTVFLKEIRKAIEEFCPDIILCHHLYLLTAFVREAFPTHKVFGVCHGSDLRQIRKNKLEREFIKKQIANLDGIFALHDVQKKEIEEIYCYNENRVTVIGVGYNERIFYQTNRRAMKPPMQIIFAGKISEKKGVFSLLRSMEYLQYEKQEVILKLAGGSGAENEFQEIRHLAAKNKYPVEFLGKLTQKELAEEFNRCHLFVLPSFYEGLPLVTVEAMACGLNVVVTDLPGIQEWLAKRVEGNTVVYVKPPQMKDADVPVEEELEDFEKRLGKAITEALEKQQAPSYDLMQISWNGVCEKILRVIEKS
ncbi:glycosyltransferase family 4 protein [Lachnospiraceae bacterium OttesenSCG-928-E19]|nr:glycosyltransferase family 4 protein [Lachnospiraceae bacterium OttesenSCG-928-E19]